MRSEPEDDVPLCPPWGPGKSQAYTITGVVALEALGLGSHLFGRTLARALREPVHETFKRFALRIDERLSEPVLCVHLDAGAVRIEVPSPLSAEAADALFSLSLTDPRLLNRTLVWNDTDQIWAIVLRP